MANNKVRQIASEAIIKGEGDTKNVIKDIKGIPTLGKGLNLTAPLTRTVLQGFGYNTDDIISGKVQVPEEVLNDAYEYLLDKSLGEVQNKFADQGLSENELAALTSMHYNSPSLIGPKITEALMKGDKAAATKEILLNSNREKNRGLAKRRLEEANLFSGGKLPDLNPEETMDLRGYFQDMPDTAEKRKLYTDYPFLNPEQVKTGYPFMKIRKNLYSPMKDEYEASKAQPAIQLPPPGNFGDTFSSPDDNMTPAVTDVTNMLDQYNLLKRMKP